MVSTLFCTGAVPMTITCDKTLTALYMDGVEVTVDNSDKWKNADYADIPDNVRTLAVQCSGQGNDRGFMANIQGGVVTGDGT